MGAPLETYLLLGFALSLVTAVGGVLVTGIVLVKLPPGYFVRPALRPPSPAAHPLVRWTVLVLRNLAGGTLVALGLLLSVPGVPGPGIMTMLLGLTVMDFAAKRRWTTWVITRRPIFRAANALRRKYGKPPLVMPPASL